MDGVPEASAEELSTGLEKCEEDLNREILRCKGLEERLRREIDGLRASVQAGEEEAVGSTPEYEARMYEQNAIRTRLADRLEALLPQPMDGGDGDE